MTWGYLDGCRIQTAEKKSGAFSFRGGMHTRRSVVADFIANFGHEWAGSVDSHKHDSRGNMELRPAALDFTDMAWQFFAGIHRNSAGRVSLQDVSDAVEERAIHPLHNRDEVASEFGPLRFAAIDPFYFGLDFRQ